MARFALLLAAVALCVWGCGAPPPVNLTEQGMREFRGGQYDAAIDTLSAATSEDPHDAQAYLYRGRAYWGRNGAGDAERAIEDFGEAITISPKLAEAYYCRALVYRDQGRAALAEADDRTARGLDGQLQDVYRQLPTESLPKAPPQATAAQSTTPVPGSQPQSPPGTEAAAGAPAAKARPNAVAAELQDQREYERLKKKYGDGASEDERDLSYRKLLERPNFTLPTSDPAQEETASEEPAESQSTTRRSATAQPQPITPTVSPFAPRSSVPSPSATMPGSAVPAAPTVRSPFPQVPARPTGRVEPPVNPFAPPTQQASPSRTAPPRPFSPSNSRFTNPATRNDGVR